MSIGLNDWYLLSIGEIDEMYNTIGRGGSLDDIGDFIHIQNRYMSYSEINSLLFWSKSMYTGNNYEASKGVSNTYTVRPIRSF